MEVKKIISINRKRTQAEVVGVLNGVRRTFHVHRTGDGWYYAAAVDKKGKAVETCAFNMRED